jgi:hypothetical protein
MKRAVGSLIKERETKKSAFFNITKIYYVISPREVLKFWTDLNFHQFFNIALNYYYRKVVCEKNLGKLQEEIRGPIWD